MIKEKNSMSRMVWWSMHESKSVETGVQHLGNHKNRNWLESLQEDTGLLARCNPVSISLVWILTDTMITTMADILSVLLHNYIQLWVKNSTSFNFHGEVLEYKKLQTYSVMVTSSDPRLSLIASLKVHIALQYSWRL